MRISDWSSDVCSSDLLLESAGNSFAALAARFWQDKISAKPIGNDMLFTKRLLGRATVDALPHRGVGDWWRSEEHTSELQSLMRISYAVFCLKKKTCTYVTYEHIKNMLRKLRQK